MSRAALQARALVGAVAAACAAAACIDFAPGVACDDESPCADGQHCAPSGFCEPGVVVARDAGHAADDAGGEVRNDAGPRLPDAGADAGPSDAGPAADASSDAGADAVDGGIGGGDGGDGGDDDDDGGAALPDAGPPFATLRASRQDLLWGESVVLTWSAGAVDECVLTAAEDGVAVDDAGSPDAGTPQGYDGGPLALPALVALEGSAEDTPRSTTRYLLRCSGPAGDVEDEVTVNVHCGFDAERTHYGNLVITAANLASLSQLGCVTGTVSLRANTGPQDLPALYYVGGALDVDDGQTSSLAGLARLARVGGRLRVTAKTTAFTLTGMPALRSVGGGLAVESNSAGVTISGLGALESVAFVRVAFNSAPVVIAGLASLARVRGDLAMIDNYSGGRVDLGPLPALAEVEGSVVVEDCAAQVTVLGLGALALVGGRVDVYSNSASVAIDADGAAPRVGGELRIAYNSTTAPILVTALAGIDLGGRLALESNGGDVDVELGGDAFVEGELRFYDNDRRARLALGGGALVVMGGLLVQDASAGSNTRIVDVSALRVLAGGRLQVLYQGGAGSVHILGTGEGSLDVAQDIRLYDGLGEVRIAGFRSIDVGGPLGISSYDGPVTFELGERFAVGGELSVEYGSGAVTVSGAPSSVELGGLRVYYGTHVFDLAGLAPLESVGGRLEIRNLGSSFAPSFPALASIGGDLVLYDSDAVTALSLPSLALVGGDLNLYDSDAVTALSLPSLARIGGGLSLQLNAALMTLGLPALRTVDGGFTVTNNPALRQCDVQAIRDALTAGPASTNISNNLTCN